jgi:hypothetical protein
MRNDGKVRLSVGVIPVALAFLIFLTVATPPAAAQQQTTGQPGAPDATTTVDSRYLPAPRQKFQGEIGLDTAHSKSAWPARIVPPKGAPSILLILTDDVGFGAPSTFGSGGSSAVNDADYKVPFKFTGTIDKVTIAVDAPVLTPEDIKKLEAATRAATD